jgi:malto-oligosyltrehalose trehalohydrolase
MKITLPDCRVFPKTWGAEFVRDSEVRFRIWAPGVERLELRLGDVDAPMTRTDDGWFELLATGVAPGTEYAFRLPDGRLIADPASRAQAGDVHGASLVIDPTAFQWVNADWTGRPWEEAVIYELHVGTFTREGTFRAAIGRLDHLVTLGVTAVEIMPVAHFAGTRGWGYDGVLPYAPHPAYGTSDDMKAFVDAAHGRGLMVLLDVVYNHFGPEGNYLGTLAPGFFDRQRHTPWGAGIAYQVEPVRRFFIENALYWLTEYALDGLRFDAVDQIRDDASQPEILVEIAQRVRSEMSGRMIHLVTEDNRNITYLHERAASGGVCLYTAEWNDDFHNAAHVAATGETDGYYADFAEDTWRKLARALAEGFSYQGEFSAFAGAPRGSPSAHLPPMAFIDFLQNHDQIGNRAFGERLSALAEREMVEALTAILLLSPHVPMLFMGEEWGETRPFLFFADFSGGLAEAVREGRRHEFAAFTAFRNHEASLKQIPDPNKLDTFEASRIDWSRAETPEGRDRLNFIKRLLRIRRDHIVPLLSLASGHSGHVLASEEGLIAVDWHLGPAILRLRANLSTQPRTAADIRGEFIYKGGGAEAVPGRPKQLERCHVVFAIERLEEAGA